MAGSSEPVGFSPTEQAFLRALQSQCVPFMLVGIAAARLQGAPVVTEDIDLWFAEGSQTGIAAAAKEAGVVYVPLLSACDPPTPPSAPAFEASSPKPLTVSPIQRIVGMRPLGA